MATAAVLPPMAEVSKAKNLMHSQRPFDPALLIAKLEAHKQNVEMQRIRDQRNPASNNITGSRPRANSRPIVVRRTSMPKPGQQSSKSRKPQQKPVPTKDLERGAKPSRLQGVQCIMLPSSMAAPPTSLAPRPIAWNVQDPFLQPNVSSAPPPRRGSHDSRMSTQPTPGSHLPHSFRRGSHDSQLQHQQQMNSSSRGYRPGDAEKRRIVDSFFITPDAPGAAPSSTSRKAQPATTLYSVQEIPAHRTQREDPFGLLGSASQSSADGAAAGGTSRPKLAPHDRHNWTQQSQNGDDFRLHFSLLHRSRKEQSAPAVPTAAADAATMKPRERQQSSGEMPATLINDAVKLIKQEEKIKRRNSIVGFFRRFEI